MDTSETGDNCLLARIVTRLNTVHPQMTYTFSKETFAVTEVVGVRSSPVWNQDTIDRLVAKLEEATPKAPLGEHERPDAEADGVLNCVSAGYVYPYDYETSDEGMTIPPEALCLNRL